MGWADNGAAESNRRRFEGEDLRAESNILRFGSEGRRISTGAGGQSRGSDSPNCARGLELGQSPCELF